MDAKAMGQSKVLNLIFKPAGWLMGSKTRERFLNPVRTLQAANIKPGHTVLEIGCGPGFFTIPAAKLLGDQGSLIALDVSAGFIEQVTQKVKQAGLQNVRILRRDALDTGLDTASIDNTLLFGVIPFPMLPLSRLLPEMHRVLKPEGAMSVWLFPPLVHFWVPRAIVHSGLFSFLNKQNGVYNFRRAQA